MHSLPRRFQGLARVIASGSLSGGFGHLINRILFYIIIKKYILCN